MDADRRREGAGEVRVLHLQDAEARGALPGVPVLARAVVGGALGPVRRPVAQRVLARGWTPPPPARGRNARRCPTCRPPTAGSGSSSRRRRPSPWRTAAPGRGRRRCRAGRSPTAGAGRPGVRLGRAFDGTVSGAAATARAHAASSGSREPGGSVLKGGRSEAPAGAPCGSESTGRSRASEPAAIEQSPPRLTRRLVRVQRWVGGGLRVHPLRVRVRGAGARRILALEPHTLLGVGLLVAIGQRLGGPPGGAAPDDRPLGPALRCPASATLDLGTPLLFDVGVYLVVVGVALMIILPLAEE